MYTRRYIYVYRSILCKACGFGGGHNSDPSSPRYQPVNTSDVYEGDGLSSTRQSGPATAKELELAQFQRMAGIDTSTSSTAGGAGGLYHLSSSSKNQQKKGKGSMVYADLDDDDLDDAYDTLPAPSTANTTGVYTTSKPPAVKGMSLTGGGPKKSTSLTKPPSSTTSTTTSSTTNTHTNNTTNKVSYLADEEDSDDFDFDNKFSGQVKTVAAPLPKAKSGLKPISKK